MRSAEFSAVLLSITNQPIPSLSLVLRRKAGLTIPNQGILQVNHNQPLNRLQSIQTSKRGKTLAFNQSAEAN